MKRKAEENSQTSNPPRINKTFFGGATLNHWEQNQPPKPLTMLDFGGIQSLSLEDYLVLGAFISIVKKTPILPDPKEYIAKIITNCLNSQKNDSNNTICFIIKLKSIITSDEVYGFKHLLQIIRAVPNVDTNHCIVRLIASSNEYIQSKILSKPDAVFAFDPKAIHLIRSNFKNSTHNLNVLELRVFEKIMEEYDFTEINGRFINPNIKAIDKTIPIERPSSQTDEPPRYNLRIRKMAITSVEKPFEMPVIDDSHPTNDATIQNDSASVIAQSSQEDANSQPIPSNKPDLAETPLTLLNFFEPYEEEFFREELAKPVNPDHFNEFSIW